MKAHFLTKIIFLMKFHILSHSFDRSSVPTYVVNSLHSVQLNQGRPSAHWFERADHSMRWRKVLQTNDSFFLQFTSNWTPKIDFIEMDYWLITHAYRDRVEKRTTVFIFKIMIEIIQKIILSGWNLLWNCMEPLELIFAELQFESRFILIWCAEVLSAN